MRRVEIEWVERLRDVCAATTGRPGSDISDEGIAVERHNLVALLDAAKLVEDLAAFNPLSDHGDEYVCEVCGSRATFGDRVPHATDCWYLRAVRWVDGHRV